MLGKYGFFLDKFQLAVLTLRSYFDESYVNEKRVWRTKF